MPYVDIADIRDYGATDSLAAAPVDCAVQVQAAIDSGKPVYVPPHAPGRVFAVSNIVLNKGARLFGEGEYRSSLHHIGSADFVEFRDGFSVIEGLTLDCSLDTGGSVFKARTDLGHMDRVQIRHIETVKAKSTFKDGNHASNVVNNLKFERVVMKQQMGNGCDFRNAFAYLEVSDVTCDFIGGAPGSNIAFQLRKNQGSYWRNVDVTGGTVNGSTVANHAFFFDSCTAVWLDKVFADTVGGHGFYFFGDCHAFKSINCGSSLVGNYPVAIGATTGICTDIQFIGFGSYGRRGMSYAPANIPGFYALNTDRLRIFSGNSLNHTGMPVETIGCTNSPNHSMNTN